MRKLVTLNEYIASLQKIAATHGNEELIATGACCGVYAGLNSPLSVRLGANGSEHSFYVPAYKDEQPATHTKICRIKIGATTYKFRIVYGDVASEHGIFLGKITELELMTETTGKVVADFNKVWKLEPKTKSANKAVEILLRNFN